MRIALAIATVGRTETLSAMLTAWRDQTRALDHVVISTVPGEAEPEIDGLPLRVLRGPKGLCRQRNEALNGLAGAADVVIFVDDDFLPSSHFVAQVERLFTQHPDIAVATGRVLADGATGGGVPLDEAMALIEAEDRRTPPSYPAMSPTLGAYGCNMVIHTRVTEPVRFDDRLPLYGWQEDIDFSRRCSPYGAVVRTDAFCGVHMGAKSGRTSGVKLGYSQVINPIYLVAKGTMPAPYALKLVVRNVVANLARSLRPEPYVDRPGRLRGNALALLDLMRARIEPERMSEIS
ncbi:MAG: glycosyltransferase [Caulobacteraceae bacterium]